LGQCNQLTQSQCILAWFSDAQAQRLKQGGSEISHQKLLKFLRNFNIILQNFAKVLLPIFEKFCNRTALISVNLCLPSFYVQCHWLPVHYSAYSIENFGLFSTKKFGHFLTYARRNHKICLFSAKIINKKKLSTFSLLYGNPFVHRPKEKKQQIWGRKFGNTVLVGAAVT
jgi:hypothetical protein